MSLIELLNQDGYPRTGNDISLVAMLNLSGGVLPKTYGGYPTTRRLQLLLRILNEAH